MFCPKGVTFRYIYGGSKGVTFHDISSKGVTFCDIYGAERV